MTINRAVKRFKFFLLDNGFSLGKRGYFQRTGLIKSSLPETLPNFANKFEPR